MDETAQHIVVFDGICALCVGSVRFIIARDPRRLFSFAPAQSAAGRALLARYGIDPDRPQTFLLISQGKAYQKSEAALHIAKRLSGPWRLAAVLFIVPRAARDWVYAVLARNRYRWFGRRDTCLVPSEDVRGRFLE